MPGSTAGPKPAGLQSGNQKRGPISRRKRDDRAVDLEPRDSAPIAESMRKRIAGLSIHQPSFPRRCIHAVATQELSTLLSIRG